MVVMAARQWRTRKKFESAVESEILYVGSSAFSSGRSYLVATGPVFFAYRYYNYIALEVIVTLQLFRRGRTSE